MYILHILMYACVNNISKHAEIVIIIFIIKILDNYFFLRSYLNIQVFFHTDI